MGTDGPTYIVDEKVVADVVSVHPVENDGHGLAGDGRRKPPLQRPRRRDFAEDFVEIRRRRGQDQLVS